MSKKRYLKIFDTQSVYESQKDSVMGTPHIVLLEGTNSIVFEDEYEYVDLGLPSGTLWATKNVGAESEEDFGLYFSWGNVEGATKEGFESGDLTFGTDGNMVKYVDPSAERYTKYNATDGKTTLDLEDDAAHVHMGEDWRMPTKEQCTELISYTVSSVEVVNNVNGTRLTSTRNNKSIFIPFAGSATFAGRIEMTNTSSLWSSEMNYNNDNSPNSLNINNDGSKTLSSTPRINGHSIRGVKKNI